MKSFFLLIMLIIIPNLHAAYFEWAFDFGYDRQKYGTSRQNSVVSRSYSGGLSSYIFDLTAIDFSFSKSLDYTTENDRYNVATNIDIVGQQNRVYTTVYGVGIKQMLAGRGARIVPMISVGYAKEFLEYNTDINIENTQTLARSTISSGTTKQRTDSIFASFILQIKMTDRFSLKGTIKTLFPASEFDKARDNVKYLIGFSWIM